ncbi:hypothetical protein [Corynebacterium kalidii]
MPTGELEYKLAELAAKLDKPERENLKLLLSMAAGGLISGHASTDDREAQKQALDIAQKSLPLLQRNPKHAVPDGIVHIGRAPFFADDDLEALDKESRLYRSHAKRFHNHYVASDAPVAKEIALSSAINEFLTDKVGPALPTNKANYLYYDSPGLGIDPHVDKDVFSLNVLTMLEHSGARKSVLKLYPNGTTPITLELQPGESLVFLADRVTHERTPTTGDENIRLVSFGYAIL